LDADPKIVGIISGYKISSSIDIDENEMKILIQKSSDILTGYSDILIDTTG
jgi:hypothetical protein